MRTVYLIAYDVCDPRRLRSAHRILTGVGTALQYSVYQCELSPLELHGLRERLWEVLNWAEDRVLVANLGPVDGRGDESVLFWGAPKEGPPHRGPTVI